MKCLRNERTFAQSKPRETVGRRATGLKTKVLTSSIVSRAARGMPHGGFFIIKGISNNGTSTVLSLSKRERIFFRGSLNYCTLLSMLEWRYLF